MWRKCSRKGVFERQYLAFENIKILNTLKRIQIIEVILKLNNRRDSLNVSGSLSPNRTSKLESTEECKVGIEEKEGAFKYNDKK
jgi:hypothetical protein